MTGNDLRNPPTASAKSSREHLDEKWQERFNICDKFATPEGNFFSDIALATFRQLDKKERQKIIGPRILPFFFGTFYYLAKGMWQKGLFILGAAMLVGFLIDWLAVAINTEFPSIAYAMPAAVFCAMMANYDYYRRVEYGERIWPATPRFLSHSGSAIAFPTVIFVLTLFVNPPGTLAYTSQPTAFDYVNGLWIDVGDYAFISVTLDEQGGTLEIEQQQIPVSVISASVDERRVLVKLAQNTDEPQQWLLSQRTADEGLRMLLEQEGGEHFVLQFAQIESGE